MIVPIVAYGFGVLRREAEEIEIDDPSLPDLVTNLYDTMDNADGVGLAAPQIAVSKRVFVVDASAFSEENPELEGFRKAFINPIMVEEQGDKWKFNEGCLSIPGIREDVSRLSSITLEYYNDELELVEETFEGMAARIIQHEYDHIEGVLFTDKINPLKKRLLKSKLNRISKGEVEVKYRMNFPLKKGVR